MMQRTITGAVLVVAAAVLLYFGGAVLGVAAMLCICFAVHEEYHALTLAGHRPVSWPTWAAIVLSVPLTHVLGVQALLVILLCACLITIAHVVFRTEPKLEDALMSLLPMMSVMLPGLCVVGLASIEPKGLQRVLMCLVIAVPVIGDTMAYFVGSAIRGPKLCPSVSPNKTIAGAIGGLVGSVVAAALVGVVAHLCCQGFDTARLLPRWWVYLVLGVVGGIASQLGDLFASLVKRHCGVKDFSNLFPGHGGMMDRLDSILFMAVVVFSAKMMGM